MALSPDKHTDLPTMLGQVEQVVKRREELIADFTDPIDLRGGR